MTLKNPIASLSCVALLTLASPPVFRAQPPPVPAPIPEVRSDTETLSRNPALMRRYVQRLLRENLQSIRTNTSHLHRSVNAEPLTAAERKDVKKWANRIKKNLKNIRSALVYFTSTGRKKPAPAFNQDTQLSAEQLRAEAVLLERLVLEIRRGVQRHNAPVLNVQRHALVLEKIDQAEAVAERIKNGAAPS